MWLHAPEVVEDVLWEGMLEPETEVGVDRVRQAVNTQGNLGEALRHRYDRSGDLDDLARAIEAFTQAVEQSPPSSPDLPRFLAKLGAGLRDRYQRTGDPADLERSVEAFEQAVEHQADLQDDLRNLPVISIGHPKVWPLPELY